MKLRFLSALAAGLLLTAAACQSSDSAKSDGAPVVSAADQSFNTFKEAFIERLWRLNPDWAAYQGNHKYDAALVINDSAWRAGAHEQYARELDRLGAFPADSLSPHNQTDHRMIADFLRGAGWGLDSLRAWEWDPSTYNLGDPIGQLLNGRHAPLNKRLQALSDKLSKAPDYYEAATRNLRHPSVEHTRLAILQNTGTLALLPQVLDSVKKSTLRARSCGQPVRRPTPAPWLSAATWPACKRASKAPPTRRLIPTASARNCTLVSFTTTSPPPTRPSSSTSAPWPTRKSC